MVQDATICRADPLCLHTDSHTKVGGCRCSRGLIIVATTIVALASIIAIIVFPTILILLAVIPAAIASVAVFTLGAVRRNATV